MSVRRIKSLLVCTVLCLSAFAQTEGYQFAADIVPVKETGFYNILLTPQFKAHIKKDYSDLRFVNSSGKWVPHLVRNPSNEQTYHNARWDFSIVKNVSNKDVSELIISAGKQKISNLRFRLRNTAVERFGNLTGSEDSINWFIINDSVQLRPSLSDVSGESDFVVKFPTSTYQFYKLVIVNKGKAPYAISKVTSEYAITKTGINDSLWQPLLNPATSITQKDSGKISYITVVQTANFHSNKIQLFLSGSKYFNRLVELYLPEFQKQSNNSPRRFVTSFAASNNSSLLFNIPLFNDSIFYLAIRNDDNLPLKVNEVKTFSDRQVATVFLEKYSAYSIIMSNAAATLPKYDLQTESIDPDKNLRLATTGNIRHVTSKNAQSRISCFKSKGILWLVIFAAAVVLTFFTFRLIKDIGKTKDGI